MMEILKESVLVCSCLFVGAAFVILKELRRRMKFVFVFCSVLFSKTFLFSFWKYICHLEGVEEEDEVAAAGGQRLPNSAGVQVFQVICQ